MRLQLPSSHRPLLFLGTIVLLSGITGGQLSLKEGAQSFFILPPNLVYFEERGLQEIASAKKQTDPALRDKMLRDAILFFKEALPYKSGLWEDVLQSRYLLCQTFEPGLNHFLIILNRKHSANTILENKIRSGFEQIQDTRKQLAYYTSPQFSSKEYLSLKATLTTQFTQQIPELLLLKNDTYFLSKSIEEYSERVNAYLIDAQTAQAAHYPISTKLLSNLSQKSALLSELNDKLSTAPTSISKTIEQLESLTNDELSRLKTTPQSIPISEDEFHQKLASLLNQMPSSQELTQQLAQALSIDISPQIK